jgi:hypothetical protein
MRWLAAASIPTEREFVVVQDLAMEGDATEVCSFNLCPIPNRGLDRRVSSERCATQIGLTEIRTLYVATVEPAAAQVGTTKIHVAQPTVHERRTR